MMSNTNPKTSPKKIETTTGMRIYSTVALVSPFKRFVRASREKAYALHTIVSRKKARNKAFRYFRRVGPDPKVEPASGEKQTYNNTAKMPRLVQNPHDSNSHNGINVPVH
jgi:hypothetical protein